jgi:hypothetical protein
MSAAQSAEAQARLNVTLKDIVGFYVQAGIDEKSVALMESFIEKHLTVDFLSLAEGFGKCMAFINHDELISLLLKAFLGLIDGYVIERKMVNKRLKLLKEDKKADQEVVARLERLIGDIDDRKALAMTTANRLKAMNMVPLALFNDPKFDAYSYYRTTLLAKQKEALVNAPPPKKKG